MIFSKNVTLGRPLKLTPWRKLAIGSWKNVCEASVYASLDLDAERIVRRLEQERKATGTRITLTSVVVRAIAEVLKEYPNINTLLRLGRLYPRQSVDIFVHVAMDERGDELTGFVVREADKKLIGAIAKECEDVAWNIRRGGDGFRKTKKLFGLLPGCFARFLLGLSSRIMYALNLWSPLLGTPRDPFGSAMVTNVGALGASSAFAPIAPYTHVPIVVAVGAIEQRAVVQEGMVQVKPILPLSVTFDHRVVDGLYASLMAKKLKEIFKNPDTIF